MDKMVGPIISKSVLKLFKILALLIIVSIIAPIIYGISSLAVQYDLLLLNYFKPHFVAFRNSYMYSLISGSLTTIIGLIFSIILFGWFNSHKRENIAYLSFAPFFASTAARLFAWVLLFSTSGAVGIFLNSLSILKTGASPLNLPLSLVTAFITIYLPAVLFTFYSFGSLINESTEETAYTLGAGRWGIGLRIRKSLYLRAVIVSILFVAISTKGALMVPSVLGGETGWFITTSIDYLLNFSLQRKTAMVLANTDMTLTLVFFFFLYFVYNTIPENYRKLF